MTMRILQALLSLMLLAAPALAQDAGGSTQKIDIAADQMEIVDADKQAVFTGNVDLKRGNVRWTSETMTVKYDEVKQADGTSRTEVSTVDSRGSVKIVSGPQVITGQWAKMNVKANTLQVGGNVKVTSGKSVLTGELMNTDLNTSRIQFSGGRVKGWFLPN